MAEVLIPDWIVDNATFLRWAESDDAPERGKIGYFQGKVWVDQTMETDFHNFIKSEVAITVGQWVRGNDMGRYYTDGMLFSSPEIELSSEPDGIFVAKESKATGKVWLEKGKSSMVLFGVPDLVLEVVSKSSRNKDLNLLHKLYHLAGIAEYWVINSLDKNPNWSSIAILKRPMCQFVHNRAGSSHRYSEPASALSSMWRMMMFASSEIILQITSG